MMAVFPNFLKWGRHQIKMTLWNFRNLDLKFGSSQLNGRGERTLLFALNVILRSLIYLACSLSSFELTLGFKLFRNCSKIGGHN